jgi:tellurite resistance protein TerC
MFMQLLASAENVNVRHYDVPWFLYAAVAAALIGYAIIEIRQTKHDHVITFKQAVHWSVFYIALALAFSIPIFIFVGSQAGTEYLAAWGIEKALSLDNLFIIGIIFASFKVDPALERRMLDYGIAGAIIFRLIFILAGVELLTRFEWVSVIFGALLVHAAWKTLKEARTDDEQEQADIATKRIWKILRKVLPIHPKFDGHKLTTVVNGKRMLTMMAGVIIVIELTDIIFAIDSVPAVLAVSPDRFIAYSSNIFALLGLRALFFVYQAVEDKFWALNWALAVILGWIGFKMIAAPFGFHVPVGISLGVLVVLLGGAMAVSLIWPKHEKTAN